MKNGQKSNKNTIYIKTLNVDSTIETGVPVLDNLEISNAEKFFNSIEEADVEDVATELLVATNLINTNTLMIKERLEQLQTAYHTMKNMFEDHTKLDEGNLVIGSESGGLAHIIFNTVDGETVKLKTEEIEKIGQVIINAMMLNSDIDLENKQEVDDLVSEIEFKIIDSLPSTLKAGNFNINKDVLIKEIQALKEEFSSDDEDEDDIENI